MEEDDPHLLVMEKFKYSYMGRTLSYRSDDNMYANGICGFSKSTGNTYSRSD